LCLLTLIRCDICWPINIVSIEVLEHLCAGANWGLSIVEILLLVLFGRLHSLLLMTNISTNTRQPLGHVFTVDVNVELDLARCLLKFFDDHFTHSFSLLLLRGWHIGHLDGTLVSFVRQAHVWENTTDVSTFGEIDWHIRAHICFIMHAAACLVRWFVSFAEIVLTNYNILITQRSQIQVVTQWLGKKSLFSENLWNLGILAVCIR